MQSASNFFDPLERPARAVALAPSELRPKLANATSAMSFAHRSKR